MKHRPIYIFLIVVFTLAAIRWVYADDYYIDDVYYWESNEQVQHTQVIVEQPAADEQAPAVEIQFIEDSITQHSDTVVKAVIRR